MQPWWVRYPNRLIRELLDLKTAGIHYRPDQGALSEGVYRLSLRVKTLAGEIDLVATFPDLYPYFRFEIAAPDLNLAHHQNPLIKNLCLIGRSTYYWHTSDTVASLLGEKLEEVLRSGSAVSKAQAKGFEQEQAEPITEYYAYPPSMVLVDETIRAPHDRSDGFFEILVSELPKLQKDHLLRGVLSKVTSSGGFQSLCDRSLKDLMNGGVLKGRWIRLEKPILHNGLAFLENLLHDCPILLDAPANEIEGGWLYLFATIVPEEASWRDASSDGWIFACLHSSEKILKSTETTLRKRNTMSKQEKKVMRNKRKLEKQSRKKNRRR